MSKILVTYASKHGHTARIVARIAERLEESGAEVVVRDVLSDPVAEVHAFDAVVVGASIHMGHHQPEAVEWVRQHATELNAMPSGLFSVCLVAADDTEESAQAARAYIDDLLEDTGWQTHVTTTFAGALQYLEYDFMTRLLMRLLMARGGHDTDTAHDHDYTDWDAVDRFADEIAALVPTPVGA